MRTRNHTLLALTSALGLALGAGSAHAQGTINVGGAGTIGNTILPVNGGIAKLPESGDKWSTNGGNPNVYSNLLSPSIVVPATGNVTLTFTHRFNFEVGFDGGAVFVSVNGGTYTYLDGTAFSANGYSGNVTGSNVWTGGENVFGGASAGYGTPALIQSVANLGSFTAGDTVSVEFRGGWDDGFEEAPPNWEIGTVKLTDSAATNFLNADFVANGRSGFTVSNLGSVSGPWNYRTPISRFEITGTPSSDRYKPSVAGSVIDLNDADIKVVLLSGTVTAGQVFSLFDLSGGTTLTGTIHSISLPELGVWDTTNLETAGTITFVSPPPSLLWNVDGDGDWDTVTANWTGASTKYSDGSSVTIDDTVSTGGIVNVVNPNTAPFSTTVDTAGTYIFATGNLPNGVTNSISSGTLVKKGSGTLQLGDSGLSTGNIYSNGFSSVSVNEGTLKYANKNAFGSGTVTLADGTTLIKYGQEGNGSSLAVTNAIVLNGEVTAVLSFGGTKDQWFSGAISGSGSWRVVGDTRAFSLSGNNTFSGGMTLASSNAWIQIGNINALGTGTLTIQQTGNQNRGFGASANLSADPGVPNNIVIDSGATFNVGNSNNMRLEGVISGDGSLNMQNNVTVILDGACTYTGGTRAKAGTLTINGSLADSTMSIQGGTVNGTGTLAFNIDGTTSDLITMTSGTLTATGLTVAVSPTGSGLTESAYVLVDATGGGTISGTFAGLTGAPGYQLNYDTANQIKLVKIGGGSPYNTWSGGAAANVDTNNDGVANGLAWVLGAANPAANAIGLLPTLDNISDATYAIFTFNRSDLANDDANTTIAVQYGNDLSGWTTAVNDGTNVIVTVTTGSPTDQVKVKLKRSTLGANGKLFARLNVVVAP